MPKKTRPPEDNKDPSAPPVGDHWIQYRPLSELKRAPRNPKTHELGAIQASVERFGFAQPLLMDESSGTLVAGHGRLETLELLKATGKPAPDRIQVRSDGEWMVPVIRGVGFLDETEAEAYLLADNRLVEIGGWSETLLAEAFKDQGKASLTQLGWDASMVDSLLASLNPDAVDAVTTAPHVGEDGVSNIHPSTSAAKDLYDQGTIRQIILYLTTENYEPTLDRLAKVMRSHGLKNHSEVLLHLLDQYESGTSPES